ncbi:PE-PPE domain-containing protein [Nocardia asiatica]|uniref:PE-PPE domain-containing protein n=1 Tax=Nocardia asiatica TaxID=209252 RepID=UPI002454F3A0|nr:PE-PPE domain-containing protein [Nocardia asiatica]
MTRSGRRITILGTTCAVAGITFLGPLGFAAPAATAAPDCRDIVIGVGGNGQRALEQAGKPTLMADQLAHYAAEGYRVESLDYPSSIWPTGPYTKDESVTEGTATLRERVDAYRAECPGGHVTVVGHSLGAEFADQGGADKVITYGDPRQPGGIYDALPGIYPGTSNPGSNPAAGNQVRICHEFDAICDSPAPWSDPARFVQGWAGYAMGWHGYAPGEGDDLPPGDYFIEAPAPLPWLPESTPTGIPAAPYASLPAWQPGPLPSLQDFDPLVEAVTPEPYHPTPLSDYIPDEIEPYIPAEALAYIPPPPPEIALPPLPDMGVRLP